jgi:hypothetical protein
MFRSNKLICRNIPRVRVGIPVRTISVTPDNAYVKTVVDTIFKCSLGEGVPYWPLSNSKQLAYEYKYDDRFNSDIERVEELVMAESAKSFGVGFLTGVGGVLSLPIGLPAALMSSWILQARLSGTIAELNGYDTNIPINRTRILLSMVDYSEMLNLVENKMKENLEDDGTDILTNDKTTVQSSEIDQQLYLKAGQEIGLSRLPIGGYAFVQSIIVRNMVGKVGSRVGVAGTGRAIPLIGGFIAGGVDTYTVNKVGENAIKIFKPIVEKNS